MRPKAKPKQHGKARKPTSLGGITASFLSGFSLYPRLPTEDSKAKTSWLDFLREFGATFLQLFVAVIPIFTGTNDALETQTVVTGVTGGLLIGPEDLVRKHAFCRTKGITVNDRKVIVNTVPFMQAKINTINVRVIPSVELSQRGGMIVAALVPLGKDEADLAHAQLRYFNTGPSTPTLLIGSYHDQLSFDRLRQYPGAKAGPATRPLMLRRKATGYAGARHVLGGTTNEVKATGTIGGPVVYRLIYGYSDFATDTKDPTLRYNPAEAMVSVQITGSVTFFEPTDSTYMRVQTPLTASPNTDTVHVSIVGDGGSYNYTTSMDNLKLSKGHLSLIDQKLVLRNEAIPLLHNQTHAEVAQARPELSWNPNTIERSFTVLSLAE